MDNDECFNMEYLYTEMIEKGINPGALTVLLCSTIPYNIEKDWLIGSHRVGYSEEYLNLN